MGPDTITPPTVATSKSCVAYSAGVEMCADVAGGGVVDWWYFLMLRRSTHV